MMHDEDMSKTDIIRRKETRVNGSEFCRLEVELREGEEGKLELSICGTAGYILTPAQARRESQEYNESWLKESDENMAYIRERSGIRFRSVKAAAKWIRCGDGEYSGLEVVKEDADCVYICHSCGQIRAEIAQYFPEVVKYFQWHLNAMRPSADGSAWDYEPLPQQVIDWAKSVGVPA